MLPLGDIYFRIAVVEGNAPFLIISSSFLKGIQAAIDTDKETLRSKLLNRFLQASRNPKNLFLMDLNQLWQSDVSAEFSQPQHRGTSESYLATDVKNSATGEINPGNQVERDQNVVHHDRSTCSQAVMSAGKRGRT